MHRIFPSAVVACIRDRHPPEINEITSVSKRLWLEGVSVSAHDQPDLADRFAMVALSGTQTGTGRV